MKFPNFGRAGSWILGSRFFPTMRQGDVLIFIDFQGVALIFIDFQVTAFNSAGFQPGTVTNNNELLPSWETSSF